MAKGRILRGGGFLEKLPEYEGQLKIAYGIGVVILIVLIYIVFFSKGSKVSPSSTTPSPSEIPFITTSSTKIFPTSLPTTVPTDSITSKVTTKITDLKKKIGEISDEEVIAIIKGKLEDWGDDINKLPPDVKEKAMACFKSTDGCIF